MTLPTRAQQEKHLGQGAQLLFRMRKVDLSLVKARNRKCASLTVPQKNRFAQER
jgi:hypothetical protein